MVGTAEPLPHLTLLLLEEPRAAVAADVVEGARPAVLAADHEDALGPDLAGDVGAGLGDRRDVAGADPAVAEDVGQLPLEHRGVGEGAGRQHRRSLDRLESRFHIHPIKLQRHG